MKLKIRPYWRSLLKENILYIIALIFLFVIILVFIIFNLPKLIKNQEKIKTLSQEIKTLQTKVEFLTSAPVDSKELEEDIKFLSLLLPDEEDYFSIIYALEQLSLKTGFYITSYTVSMKNSNNNKLTLIVTGIGDKESFIKFLKQYNFGGGRLITSDKIELSQEMIDEIKINLTFYTYKNPPTKKNILQTNPNQYLSQLKELKNKLRFSLKDVSITPSIDYNYPRKSNPF